LEVALARINNQTAAPADAVSQRLLSRAFQPFIASNLKVALGSIPPIVAIGVEAP
jgi:hypothetical protein